MKRRRVRYKKCACCLHTYVETCFRQRGTGRDKLCLQCVKLPPLIQKAKLLQAAAEQEVILYPVPEQALTGEVLHAAS